ncbi:MAG: hypothetical protein ACC707_11780, partial [Thiohalomonadales bacterium]
SASLNRVKREFLNNCGRLGRELENALGTGNPNGTGLPELLGSLAQGINQEKLECLRKPDPVSQMVDQIERYNECRREEQYAASRQSRFTASGAVDTGLFKPHRDGTQTIRDFLKGLTPDGEPTNWAGLAGAQEDYSYRGKDENGETTTVRVSYSSQMVENESGQWEEQTSMTVVAVNSQGTTVYGYDTTSGGMIPTSTSWKSADGTATYRATHNENGTLAEEIIIDEDGSVTKVTYDENGNVVKTETSNTNDDTGGTEASDKTRPAEEDYSSNCVGLLHEGPRSSTASFKTDLSPWIIPDPGAAPDDIELCFDTAQRNTQTCPPSVALCIEPGPDPCSCKSYNNNEVPPPSIASACLRIQCPEGSMCSPETGNCKNGDKNVPGEWVLPPIPINGPQMGRGSLGSIRKTLGATWAPPLSNTRMREILGIQETNSTRILENN